ncbi:hypothetical protein KR767_09990 [Luteibacter anthropi]|uniref:hypothetical protein n=1 Tax=Luteibacter anthropi TaxID=564369 RepID=UPI00203289B6|nr:hypothetical protein [Luteibacter anthropi]URX64345.1 hypothetical protein KR767_09990 [Luteibacter anthropi]
MGKDMEENEQEELFSSYSTVDVFRVLLADLHGDVDGKIGRFHQLADLSTSLGSAGSILAGGEVAFNAWVEARSSFVHGNFIATVLLCQSLAEHLLAARLNMFEQDRLPNRIAFQETLKRCLAAGLISPDDEADLRCLMGLRNPLSHFRDLHDPASLFRRSLETMSGPEEHLRAVAAFAITMAVRLLSLPAFRVDGNPDE